jgi:hypothetical protein
MRCHLHILGAIFCLSSSFLAFSTISCGDLLFPPLEVVAVSVPTGYIALADIGSLVTITLNSPVAPHTAQQALRMSEDGAAFKGRIDVAGQNIRFTPAADFSVDKDYELSVSVDLENEKGISLTVPLNHCFSTRIGRGGPRVTSIVPSPNTNLAERLSCIELRFSKPVERASLTKALSISPSFDYIMDFYGDRAVLRPVSPLKNAQRYLITLGTDLCDLSGNRLALAFTSTFLNGTDSSPPTYTLRVLSEDPAVPTEPLEAGGFVNEGLRAPCTLSIDFDEPILVSALASLIIAGEGVQIKVDADKETRQSATITVPLEWGARCDLTIKRGIADLSENATADDQTFTLLADHEATRPVTVVSTELYAVDLGTVEIVPEQNFTVLQFPSALFPLDELFLATWTVLVRISTDADTVTRASAMAALRIANKGCLEVSIRTLTVSPARDDHGGGRLVTLSAGLEIRNRDTQGLLHFEVAQTLADDLGNTLAAPWAVVVNKE